MNLGRGSGSIHHIPGWRTSALHGTRDAAHSPLEGRRGVILPRRKWNISGNIDLSGGRVDRILD